MGELFGWRYPAHEQQETGEERDPIQQTTE